MIAVHASLHGKYKHGTPTWGLLFSPEVIITDYMLCPKWIASRFHDLLYVSMLGVTWGGGVGVEVGVEMV